MAKVAQLVQECKRQHENCLYTSTALFEWQKSVRFWKRCFVVAPLVLGGFAGWTLLANATFEGAKAAQSVCAFLAGLLPTIYTAIKLDQSETAISDSAAKFKNLQDRFRQAAVIASQKTFAEFEAEFRSVMDRMEQARCHGLAIPDRFIKRAQKTIKGGVYDFDVDISEEKKAAGGA